MALKDRKKLAQTMGRKERTVDLGLGDGPEVLTFREMTKGEHSRLFASRMTPTTDKDGKATMAFHAVNKTDYNFQTEIVSILLIDPDTGNQLFTLEELKKFRSQVMDKIFQECMLAVEEFGADEKDAADAENPSTGAPN